MVEPNTIPIDLKRRPAEEVPAAAISLWAKECGLSLTAAQIQMLALQWRVSLLVAIAEETIKVDCAARQAAAQDAYARTMNALCPYCNDGIAAVFCDDEAGLRGGWWHDVGSLSMPCTAWKIRARAAAEAEGEK